MLLNVECCFSAKDHLEKSREIIKRLKDERRDVEAQLSEARAQMEQRLSDSQQNLESEKDEEIKELRRGKVEALQVMQVKASSAPSVSVELYEVFCIT